MSYNRFTQTHKLNGLVRYRSLRTDGEEGVGWLDGSSPDGTQGTDPVAEAEVSPRITSTSKRNSISSAKL